MSRRQNVTHRTYANLADLLSDTSAPVGTIGVERLTGFVYQFEISGQWVQLQPKSVFLTNNSGVQIDRGMPVFIFGAGSFEIAAADIPSELQVIGVARDDIPNGSAGYVDIGGFVEVLCDAGAVTIGNGLFMGATPGQATDTAIPQPGVFGFACTAKAAGAPGLVTALFAKSEQF